MLIVTERGYAVLIFLDYGPPWRCMCEEVSIDYSIGYYESPRRYKHVYCVRKLVSIVPFATKANEDTNMFIDCRQARSPRFWIKLIFMAKSSTLWMENSNAIAYDDKLFSVNVIIAGYVAY
jgi:hypothetical protein